MIPPELLGPFLARHQLGPDFQQVVDRCYQPLLGWIRDELEEQHPLVLGINGAQGTGKSTLADFIANFLANFLATALKPGDVNVAVISIDDFYLSPTDRQTLADDIHPLLATRGVPGTHNVSELLTCIQTLKTLLPGEATSLPRFDKATDSAVPEDQWPDVVGPVDLIVLEGWCVASQPEPDKQLKLPINALEQQHDGDGLWRAFVNRQLKYRYGELFDLLDRLVFLAAPSFDCVAQWRQQQERKLRQASTENAPGVMDDAQLNTFMQHYERLTRHNLRTLPNIADVHVSFDANHQVNQINFRK